MSLERCAYLRSFCNRTYSFASEDNHEHDDQLDSCQSTMKMSSWSLTFIAVGTFDNNTSDFSCLVRATANSMSKLCPIQISING